MLLEHEYVVERAKSGPKRTLALTLVPINRPTWVTDPQGTYREEFTARSFAHCDPTRTELRVNHAASLPLGAGVAGTLQATPSHWVMDARVASGDRGDHVLDLVADGLLQRASVGFRRGRDATYLDDQGEVVVRAKVKQLEHVALLTPSEEPVYADAGVVAVRERKAALEAMADDFQSWLDSYKARGLP